MACICFDGRAIPLCPEHGDAKARGTRRKDQRPAADSLRSKTPMKRTRLSPTSEKEDLRSAYIQGAKDAMIVIMLRGGGAAWCEVCEKDIATTLEGARKGLDFHHQDQRRGDGKGYDHKTKNPGADHPQGALLCCRQCHRRLEEER